MSLLAIWQMQPRAGGVGPGQTTAPGHAGVDQMLAQLYQTGDFLAARAGTKNPGSIRTGHGCYVG